jgi:hypothetical protein
MKFNCTLFIFLLTPILFTCKKSNEVTTDNNLVSGKLKSIVKIWPGSIFTIKTTLAVEYDLSNRVTNFNSWDENTSISPAIISNARYRHFEYISTNQFPSKCTTTNETGHIDTTLYIYDNTNRVIQIDEYPYGGSHRRSKYIYSNSNLIIGLDSVYSAGIPYFFASDSITIGNDKSLLTWRAFDNLGKLSITYSYTYDNNKNPFNELNIFKYLYLNGDLDVGYNSIHNFVSYRRVRSGATDHVINNSYTYSSNSFPLTAQGQEGYDPAYMSTTNTIFSYY